MAVGTHRMPSRCLFASYSQYTDESLSNWRTSQGSKIERGISTSIQSCRTSVHAGRDGFSRSLRTRAGSSAFNARLTFAGSVPVISAVTSSDFGVGCSIDVGIAVGLSIFNSNGRVLATAVCRDSESPMDDGPVLDVFHDEVAAVPVEIEQGRPWVISWLAMTRAKCSRVSFRLGMILR